MNSNIVWYFKLEYKEGREVCILHLKPVFYSSTKMTHKIALSG